MNKFTKEWLPYMVIVIIVILIRTYIITPVIVRGDSMYDTLSNNEVLLLSKITYQFSNINRFDIVVIKDKDGDLIIKRVIGMPGDKIEYIDNKLYINDKLTEDPYNNYIMKNFNIDSICKITNIECNGIIPDDMYLVLGDNRLVSADSRVKGLINKNQILGHATFRLWPLNKLGVIK